MVQLTTQCDQLIAINLAHSIIKKNATHTFQLLYLRVSMSLPNLLKEPQTRMP
jgi:hypothetical protein